MTAISTSLPLAGTQLQSKRIDTDPSTVKFDIAAYLDTNGDGEVDESEFAAYRSQKQALGQYVPTETQSNFSGKSPEVERAIFELLLDQDTSE